MAPNSATLSPHKTAGQKVAHGRSAEPVLVKGRRDFFTYRDLGVADGSAGTMRAQVMKATQGLSEPTGWHYHECDGQFIYILKGWVELQFEDGRTLKVEQGDSLFIPGYLRHNEIRTSDEMEILEVSVPGELGTRPAIRRRASSAAPCLRVRARGSPCKCHRLRELDDDLVRVLAVLLAVFLEGNARRLRRADHQ